MPNWWEEGATLVEPAQTAPADNWWEVDAIPIGPNDDADAISQKAIFDSDPIAQQNAAKAEAAKYAQTREGQLVGEYQDRVAGSGRIEMIQDPSQAVKWDFTPQEMAGLKAEQRVQRTHEQLKENVPGYTNPVVRTVLHGMANAGGNVVSVAGRPGELLGGPSGADAINRQAGEFEQAAQIEDANSIIPGRLLKGGRNAVSSIAQMLATRQLGMGGMVGGFVATEANQAITEGRDAGLSGTKLATYATTRGAVEGVVTTIFNKMGLAGVEGQMLAKTIFQEGLKRAAKAIGKTTLQELPEEMIITYGQLATNAAAGIGPAPRLLHPDGSVFDKNGNLTQLADGLIDTAVATAVTTGMAGTPRLAQGAADTARGRVKSVLPDPESLGKEEASASGFNMSPKTAQGFINSNPEGVAAVVANPSRRVIKEVLGVEVPSRGEREAIASQFRAMTPPTPMHPGPQAGGPRPGPDDSGSDDDGPQGPTGRPTPPSPQPGGQPQRDIEDPNDPTGKGWAVTSDKFRPNYQKTTVTVDGKTKAVASLSHPGVAGNWEFDPSISQADATREFHKELVKRAHAEGKPVPPAVLREYGLSATEQPPTPIVEQPTPVVPEPLPEVSPEQPPQPQRKAFIQRRPSLVDGATVWQGTINLPDGTRFDFDNELSDADAIAQYKQANPDVPPELEAQFTKIISEREKKDREAALEAKRIAGVIRQREEAAAKQPEPQAEPQHGMPPLGKGSVVMLPNGKRGVVSGQDKKGNWTASTPGLGKRHTLPPDTKPAGRPLSVGEELIDLRFSDDKGKPNVDGRVRVESVNPDGTVNVLHLDTMRPTRNVHPGWFVDEPASKPKSGLASPQAEVAPPAEPAPVVPPKAGLAKPKPRKGKKSVQVEQHTNNETGAPQFIFKTPDDKEIGELQLKPRGDGSPDMVTANLVVWPEHRRNGHATDFYRHAAEWVESNGGKLYLSDDRTDDAKALHESFKKSGWLHDDGRISFSVKPPKPKVGLKKPKAAPQEVAAPEPALDPFDELSKTDPIAALRKYEFSKGYNAIIEAKADIRKIDPKTGMVPVDKNRRGKANQDRRYRSKRNVELITQRLDDAKYHRLKAAADKAERKRSAAGGQETRKANVGVKAKGLQDAAEGNVTEEAIKYAPLHELPPDVRMSIQDAAKALLPDADSPATKRALERIIEDAGADAAPQIKGGELTAVQNQKERIRKGLTKKPVRPDITKPWTLTAPEAALPQDPIIQLFLAEPTERKEMIDEAIAAIDSIEPNELLDAVWERLRNVGGKQYNGPEDGDPFDTDVDEAVNSPEDAERYLNLLRQEAKVPGPKPEESDSFELEREPASVPKKMEFEATPTTQKKLLSGMDSLPGQEDLFDDLDKAEGATPDISASSVAEPPAPDVNKLKRQRPKTFSAAPFAKTEAETDDGKALLNKLKDDADSPKPKKVGLRSIIEYMNDQLGILMMVGRTQTSKTHPAHYMRSRHLIRSRAGHWQINHHEAGHAISNMMDDAAGGRGWRRGLGEPLKALTTDEGSLASAVSVEEGVAEFVRRYVTDYANLPAELVADFEVAMTMVDPRITQVLRDAHRAYQYHQARPALDQMQSLQNDTAKPPTGEDAVSNALTELAYRLFGGSAIIHRLRRAAFLGIGGDTKWTKYGTGMAGLARSMFDPHYREAQKVAREVMAQTREGDADIKSAYNSTVRIPAESLRALGGVKMGREGVRVLSPGELDEYQIETLESLGINPNKTKYGEWLYLGKRSIARIKHAVGLENWPAFAVYGQYRTALERFDKKGHWYPGLIDGLTPEVVRKELDRLEALHPDWANHYADVNAYMDQLLAVGFLSGEFTGADVKRIKDSYESYWPLPRQVEDRQQNSGGSHNEPTMGLHRAFGSELPFGDLDEALEARTWAAMDAYYTSRLMKSLLAFSQRLANDKRIPFMVRKKQAQLMLPLQMERKAVATVSPSEETDMVVDAMHRMLLDGAGINTKGMTSARLKELVEENFGEESIVDPQDVVVSSPSRKLWRLQKPNAVHVISYFQNGERRYFQVPDPLLFDMFAASRNPDKYATLVSRALAGIAAPWRRAITQNLAFAVKNVFSRDAIQAQAAGRDMESVVPWLYAAVAAMNRIKLARGKGGQPLVVAESELLSRALDATNTDAHRGLAGSFKQMLAEGLVVPKWNKLNFAHKAASVPGVLQSAVLKPLDIFNWVTGGRYLSSLGEELTREGAMLRSLTKGDTPEQAQVEYDSITGTFGQKPGSPYLSSLTRAAGFLNPVLQIMWGHAQRMTDPDPQVRAMYFGMKLPAIAAMAGVGAAINYLLIRAMFDDDEEEEVLNRMRERQDKDRLTFMAIGGKVRLPFDSGPVGGVFSYGWNTVEEMLLADPINGRKKAMAVLSRASEFPGLVDAMPPMLKTAGEVGVNDKGWSFFLDREIVPGFLVEKFPYNAELRTLPDTPEFYNQTAKALATAGVRVSPLKIQYVVSSAFSRQYDDLAKTYDKLSKGKTPEASELPTIGTLVHREPRGWNSQSVRTVVDLDEQFQSLKAEMQESLKANPDDPRLKELAPELVKLEAAHQAMLDIGRTWQDARSLRQKPGDNADKIQETERRMTKQAQDFLKRYDSDPSLEQESINRIRKKGIRKTAWRRTPGETDEHYQQRRKEWEEKAALSKLISGR